MKQSIISLVACGLLIAGAGADAAPMAKVDGVEITEAMFDAFAASRSRKPVADLTSEERSMLSEELIKLVAISAQARKQKLHSDSEIAAQLRLQEHSLLAQAYIQRQLKERPISEAQLKARYDEKYGGAPQTEYKARHILVSSPTAATDIIGQLGAGADFVELAAKHSIGPSAKSGGDLGWFTKQSMVPAFGDAVATMQAGTFSDKPVQTQFGWHVILKEEERALPAPELSSVSQELQRELQQQAITEMVDGVRSKAKVKTYE